MVNVLTYDSVVEKWCSSERLIVVNSYCFLLKFLTGKRIINSGILIIPRSCVVCPSIYMVFS